MPSATDQTRREKLIKDFTSNEVTESNTLREIKLKCREFLLLPQPTPAVSTPPSSLRPQH
jgi:hypothetical protein